MEVRHKISLLAREEFSVVRPLCTMKINLDTSLTFPSVPLFDTHEILSSVSNVTHEDELQKIESLIEKQVEKRLKTQHQIQKEAITRLPLVSVCLSSLPSLVCLNLFHTASLPFALKFCNRSLFLLNTLRLSFVTVCLTSLCCMSQRRFIKVNGGILADEMGLGKTLVREREDRE